MAASAWEVFNAAKHNLGLGLIDLSGDTINIGLFRTSASAILRTTISTHASIGSFTSSAGGNGDYKEALGSLVWTGSDSANDPTRYWDCADPVFTASSSAISQVRYAVIWTSGASAGASKLICYAALSTAEFDVANSNTLTVQMAAGGIFTLT